MPGVSDIVLATGFELFGYGYIDCTRKKGTYEPGIVLACMLEGIVKTIVKVGTNFTEQIVGDIFQARGDSVIADPQSGMMGCMLKRGCGPGHPWQGPPGDPIFINLRYYEGSKREDFINYCNRIPTAFDGQEGDNSVCYDRVLFSKTIWSPTSEYDTGAISGPFVWNRNN